MRRGPIPEQAARLGLPAIRSAMRKAGRQRNLDARAREIADALPTDHLAAPAPVVAAFAARLRTAILATCSRVTVF
jgi:hypothetical protein